jgi:hypothetical protein
VRAARGRRQYAAAAWYCFITLAGIRLRALIAMPWSFAQARTWPLRCRPAAVREPGMPQAPGLAGVLDERRELGAEGAGVLLAQVDFVRAAVEPEPHRLVGKAAVQIVLQRDGHLLSHPHDCGPAPNGDS